jgi:hypothetical protein
MSDMKLTGKCKEEFEKWAINNNVLEMSLGMLVVRNGIVITSFYDHSKSMKYGVYVDFFDSVGLFIEIANDNQDIKTFWVDINLDSADDDVELDTRPEARTIAIKKANNIYNER